jgi:poly(3-hydroxyalkanoate) synthetase
LLTITAAKDWICPPESATVLNDLVASADKRVLELPGGHVGIVAGRRATDDLWPRLADWLIAHATAPQPQATPPSAPDHEPADIAAALRAGVALAHQVEATQTVIEAASPLEAVRQALLDEDPAPRSNESHET